MQLIYKKIDAFTGANSSGNPAACIYLREEQSISPEDMQQIAAEHKGFVSEVVYCFPLGNNSYRLKYYSSECEVEFCGHGTIACTYQLIKDANLLDVPEIRIETNKGKLRVLNHIKDMDAVYISAPAPIYLPHNLEIQDIAHVLGIDIAKIDNARPVEIIDAGLRTLIVPILSLNEVLSMFPDEKLLKNYSIENQFDTLIVFSEEVVDSGNRIRTRVFPPRFGYLEDPATGSANSAIGYYMLKHCMWDGCPISIEQNSLREERNIVRLRYDGDAIYFGGSATLRIDGKYLVKQS
jgi:PhzF family phenazine biosynthesis protein